ncbi:M23 family metallopeptidase [uncultured Paraglaciecola sp.]|uniref:M23 family metallopeptidase n=1 Tax=uncultured Paraglaciecola sp. TaxID=1765024 RepID=UPI00262C4694|nr:M23 family metallopeptidase [uncultured Paraglaciecola sp.]
MLQVITPLRGVDAYGNGAFGAPRNGSHPTHRGVDYAAAAGSQVLSPVKGRVTKHGYPYADALEFRYLEITDGALNRHRFFYTNPMVEVGELVHEGDIIASVQNISGRYKSSKKNPMVNHVHYEIIDERGIYLNPDEFGL